MPQPSPPLPVRAAAGRDHSWIRLFRDVEPATLAAALRDCEIWPLPARACLLRPGELNDNIFVILRGEVEVILDPEGGEGSGFRIPLGECIGEFSAIDGKPASALVLTRTEAEVLRLRRDHFWSELVLLNGVARSMMSSLVERNRLTSHYAVQAERERLELSRYRRELDLARQLQTAMLPPERPLFPDRQDLEVCGFIEPTEAVGGDFYDAFLVDEDKLFFCIGDVSGHGIAASLLMARAIGLLRVLAADATSPEVILENLNASLSNGNATCVFVTLFLGLLDLTSGELIYANGGHCPPLRCGPGGNAALPVPKGVLVGAFPGVRYTAMTTRLEPGDLLLLVTDGITEAMNPQGEQFGPERCLEILERQRRDSLPELLASLRAGVGAFSDSSSLDDDLTLLLVQRPDAGSRASHQLLATGKESARGVGA